MALITKRRRVANPRPLTRKRRAKKRNAASATRRHRPKATRMTRNAQGQFIKKRKSTYARKRTAKTIRTVRVSVSNPRRSKATRRRRSNPTALATLGALNPRKKGTYTLMARKRRHKANSSRRTRSTRSAAPKIIVLGGGPTRRRRSNPRRRSSVSVRRRRNSYRRNPQIFGMGLNTKTGTTLIAGGLVGVAATKAITAAVVSRVPMLQSDFGRIAISLGTAYGISMLGEKFMGQAFGSALFFGGLMQSGSVALNTFMPTLGSAFGLGEFVSAGLITPYNPILQGQQQAAMIAASAAPAGNGARISVNGLARTYGSAY